MRACTRDAARATAFDCPDTGRDMTDHYEASRGGTPLVAAVGSRAHHKQPDRDDNVKARRFGGNRGNGEGAYTTIYPHEVHSTLAGKIEAGTIENGIRQKSTQAPRDG